MLDTCSNQIICGEAGLQRLPQTTASSVNADDSTVRRHHDRAITKWQGYTP